MFILLLSLLFFSPHPANANSGGGMDGGGGQGLLCKRPGEKPTLRSLDLFEADAVWGYEIPKGRSFAHEARRTYWNATLFTATLPNETGNPEKPSDSQIEAFTKARYGQFLSQLNFIPVGARLPLSKDTGPLLLTPPTHCKLVQVLFFADEDIDSGSILVDREYWQLLNVQDRLAFMHHESIYKSLRPYGVQTSQSVRKVVGLIFRTQEFPGLVRQTYPLRTLRLCTGAMNPDIAFYLVPFEAEEESGKVWRTRLLFSKLGPIPLLVETTFDTSWNYDRWMAGKERPSPAIEGFTRSALGSNKVSLAFPDWKCDEGTLQCAPHISVTQADGSFIGGPVVCKNIR